jgi:hypothetical protein
MKHSARSVCAAAVLGVAVSCARLAGAQDNEGVLQSSLPIQVAVGIVPPPNNQSAFSASNDDMTIFWEPLALDNLAYDPTTATVVVRLCWAKADISDRPWRKFKNPADEDRQCKNKVAADKNRPFSTLNYTFTVSGNQPEGQYWARVLVIQNSSYVANGGSADAGSSPPTTDCDLMETNTNGEFVCETFQINNVMGTSVGLYVAIGLCAGLGPLMLAIFIFFERFRGAKDFEGGQTGVTPHAIDPNYADAQDEIPTLKKGEVEIADVSAAAAESEPNE